MRMIVLCAFLSIGFVTQGLAKPQPPGDLAALEEAWHACVRESFLHQSRAQSRAASQRNALDACQAGEDAYVAAAMLRESAFAERGLADRARAWASSMAADVIDPVSSWFDALRR